jgi:hypothetical protein
VSAGFVSREAAERVYGVALTDGGAVDPGRTAALRGKPMQVQDRPRPSTPA